MVNSRTDTSAKRRHLPVVAVVLMLLACLSLPLMAAEAQVGEAIGLAHKQPLDDRQLDALRGQGVHPVQVYSPNLGVILWDEGSQGGQGGGKPQAAQGAMQITISVGGAR